MDDKCLEYKKKVAHYNNLISDSVYIAIAMLNCIDIGEAVTENLERIRISTDKLRIATETLYKLQEIPLVYSNGNN